MLYYTYTATQTNTQKTCTASARACGDHNDQISCEHNTTAAAISAAISHNIICAICAPSANTKALRDMLARDDDDDHNDDDENESKNVY